MLSLRIASAVVVIPVLLGIAYVGGPMYGLLVTLAAIVGAGEVGRMLVAAGYRPLSVVLVGLAAALPLTAWFGTERILGQPLFGGESMLVLGLGVVASLLLVLLRGYSVGAMTDWALSLAGALYLGGLMQFYAPLRDRPDGQFWVIATVTLSWACDTTAFFVGRAFGRTRLAPDISPRKSVEGAVAGFGMAAFAGALWGVVAAKPVLVVAGLGAAIGAATIVGDLAESLLKRQTGVKDSGVLFPGHGGLLDRMDSLLFCAPVAVLYLHLVGLP